MKAHRIQKRLTGFQGDESGSAAVIVALLLVILLGVAGLALDYAHLAWVQRDLRKSAEAGARAGARALWPLNLWTTSTSRPDPNYQMASTAALNITTSNKVDGVNLAASEVTVEVGKWNYATQQFTPLTPATSSTANGVRVTAQRSSVQIIFGKFLGLLSKDLSASAVSIMDFAGSVGAGTLPIALNKAYTAPGTPLFINFTPDTIDNGGWFADPTDQASAKTFKDYINNAACSPLKIGDIINLQNGEDTSCLNELKDKLNLQPSKKLNVLLPVVDTDKFNQSQPIVAFVPFQISEVLTGGNPKGVNGTVLSMGEMDSALPGGSNYGALAPPKLVQ
jgi:Flp pilus assembly protein TadG